MKIAVATFSVVIGLTFLTSAVLAQADGGNVKAEMLADVSAVAPGKPFMVGFKFTIDPQWHIYWKNAGDSGLPTEVKLNLPVGFTAGELMFPVPTRLQLPGDIVNYAYENQVMLMVRITPPKDLPAGKSVALSANASWLVCKDECLPGQAVLSLDVPIADTAVPANQDLFKQWTGQLPMKEDATDIASSSKSLAIANGEGQALINIGWKVTAPCDIQFIPGPLKDGDVSNIKVATAADSTKITFDIKSFKGTDPVTGLLTFTSAAGVKTGLEISIPAGGVH